ncbi:MAG: hypothetical protein WCZ18_05805 [Ottowia sp.]|nr:hypothetical protein [Ottowia sp.]
MDSNWASADEAGTGEGGKKKRSSRSRWQLLLLALVFVAPVVASYYVYYVVRPAGRTNFGTLIDPQRAMPALVATNLDGEPVPLASLKGQWLLLSVAGGACDAGCQENLYLQRQLRAGLGKNQKRLDWVWLINDDAAVPADLQVGLRKALVLRLPPQQIASWLAPEPGHALAESLYVVDPMGHWMMRFPPNLDDESAVRARRDLSRLLYASEGWDRPGRTAADHGS